MKTGIRFTFCGQSGLDLGLTTVSDFLSDEFQKGQITLFANHEKLGGEMKIGIAGELPEGLDAIIPYDAELSLVTDLPPEKAVVFKAQVEVFNENIDPSGRSKAFAIVEPR